LADVPTTDLDETLPAGGRKINLGDNDIRAYKGQVRQVMEVDHDFPSSGKSETVGQHKQVTLQESDGTAQVGSTGVGILVAQTIGGKPELVYTDEDDNDVQITDNGVIFGITAAVINALVYPVGAIFTAGVSTNPSTLLGVGTWAAIEGKVIVGLKSTGTFNTLNGTGGVETVTLTGGQSGTSAHTHPMTPNGGGEGGTSYGSGTGSAGSGPTVTGTSTEANADDSHTNLQPYIVKYVWQRTA